MDVRPQGAPNSWALTKGEKMKNAILIAGLATIISVQAQAAEVDVGVGISIESDDSTIYIPIDIGDSIRIEPGVRYSETEIGNQLKAESLDLSVGLFKLMPIRESIRLYFGGRLAYVTAEIDQSFAGQQSHTEDDGYRISPTLGFEYQVTERFSVGGEAEWFYLDMDEENSLGLDGAQRDQGTETRILFRFKF
jgi:opacity protein-like surface antigen